MGKNKSVLIFLCLLLLPVQLPAADFGVGLVGWYSFYDSSAFEEGMRGRAGEGKTSYSDTYSITPALMLGPSFSVSFLDRWTVNFVFLGSLAYHAESEYVLVNFNPYYELPSQVEVDLHRYDFDLSLSYGVNQYLGAFAGFKYIYGWSQGTWQQVDNPANVVDNDNQGHWFGPALGLRVTLPLTEALTLTAQVSGLFVYQFTREEALYHSTGVREVKKNHIAAGGYNCYAGIVYFIEAIGITVAAGGRYQDIFYEDGAREQIYGPMASVVYSF